MKRSIDLTFLFSLLLVAGCSLFDGATRLEDMTDQEAAQYQTRTALQIELLTEAALAEGDLDDGDIRAIVVVLRAAQVGSPAGFVSDRLGDSEGYEQLALTLALIELEGRVSVGGIVSVRGAAVLGEIADRLEALANYDPVIA